MNIRRLTEADAAAFREIRLEALRTSPESFGASYEDNKDRPDSAFADMLKRYVVGAFIDGVLAGNAGFYSETNLKEVHRGHIWGVYVRPAYRGTGVARALIEDIIAHARQHVLQLELSVVTSNETARTLYERLGFSTYGTVPRALKVNGQFVDEHLMVKRLDEA
jgi:ribosomal protein S18 acetylase RimI-like enzyme